MPYIKEKDRWKYYEEVWGLIDQLEGLSEEDLAGHLNFCISKVIFRLFDECPGYVRANTISGVLANVQREFYRRKVAPYEDEKMEENGDI